MNEYSITYSAEALDDLRAVYSYIAFELKAPEAAEGQINRIRNGVSSLKELPFRHSAVEWEPWASLGIRRMPVNNFMVFYRASESAKKVEIVRILYGGRDIESQMS